MALLSAREYARPRNVSKNAVLKRTVPRGGPIPTHGPQKQIDEDEADRLWHASMRPNGFATSRFKAPDGTTVAPPPPPDPLGPPTPTTQTATLWQARTAMLLTEAQLKRLQLEERRGLTISRQVAVRKAFAFARTLRDAWLAWPARIGPEVASELGVDARDLVVLLDRHVRQQLEELARERFEF